MDAERSKRDGGSGGAEKRGVKKRDPLKRMRNTISLFDYEPDSDKVEKAVLGEFTGLKKLKE